jgi:uncharacterized RDD family membrane protein YckC
MATPPPVKPLSRRAGFWIRAAAAAIDACAAGILTALVGIGAVVAQEVPELADWAAGRLPDVVLCLLILAYTSMEAFVGATPGKMVLGLVIARPGGGRADRWTLALRWSAKQAPLLLTLAHLMTTDVLSYFLGGFMNSVVLVGCLQALDEDKRTWHDEWARTVVFRRSKVAAAVARHAISLPPPLPDAGDTP